MPRTNATTIEIHEYLRGVRYPATKNDLIVRAKQNNADKEVIELLWKLDQKRFRTSEEVIRVIEEQSR
jgi:hypothetical protein